MYSNCMQALGRAVAPVRSSVCPRLPRTIHSRRTFAAAPDTTSLSESAFTPLRTPLSAYGPSAPQYNTGLQYGEPVEAQYDGGMYQNAAGASPEPRRYIQWSIYKKSAAMSVKLVRARYEQRSDASWAMEREGSVFLEFAQALQSTGPEEQNRRFDWGNKLTFALSAVELSTLMDDPDKPHSFFHDPNMKQAGQGSVTKRLNWTPSTNQPGTYMLSLNVSDKVNQQKASTISVPISRGEYAVLKNLTPSLVWHMLGFSEVLIN